MRSNERYGMMALAFALLATAPAGCGGSGGGGAAPLLPAFKTFVTARVFDGNLIAAEGTGKANGILAADALCMKDAQYPGKGTYKALIVDGTNRIASASPNAGDGQVDWVLKPNAGYYQSDGKTPVMTTGGSGLFLFGALKNPFDPDVNDKYWTGLNLDWTTYPFTNGANQNCNGWSYNADIWIRGTFGLGGLKDSSSIYGSYDAACNATPSYHLICVQQ